MAVVLRELSVDDVPLSLERATKDRVAGFLRRRFEFIESCLRLQRSDIGGREVEGSKFGHLVRGGIIDAADQDTNMTHGALLGQDSAAMLTQLGLEPHQDLTQRLFALTDLADLFTRHFLAVHPDGCRVDAVSADQNTSARIALDLFKEVFSQHAANRLSRDGQKLGGFIDRQWWSIGHGLPFQTLYRSRPLVCSQVNGSHGAGSGSLESTVRRSWDSG